MQRHDFDLISFLFGLLFAGLAVAWLVTGEVIDADLTKWFWPLILVVAGAVVLSSTLSRARNDRREAGSTGEVAEDEQPSAGTSSPGGAS